MIPAHSPQPWALFDMLGEYDFSNERLQNNTEPKIIPENWEPPNR